MGWKDLSYWLKGGIIAIIVQIIFVLLFFLITATISFDSGLGELGGVFITPIFMLFTIIVFVIDTAIGRLFKCPYVSGWPGFYECSPYLDSLKMSISIILFILIFFLVGALIGLLVGKIKSRDNIKT
jgi:hypothetical protein